MTHLLYLNHTNKAAKLLNDSIGIINKNANIFFFKLRQEHEYDKIIEICEKLSVKIQDENVCVMGRNNLKVLLLTEISCALLMKVNFYLTLFVNHWFIFFLQNLFME